MPSPIRRDTPAIAPATRPARVAFDNFEVNTRSGELRKNGSRIRLQAQPFQLLSLLLRDAGERVTRDEICRELWPADTFFDFEHSLAAAVNKLREALDDSAENPKYIETLPKHGYRFIGKIKPDAPVVIPTLQRTETAALATVPVPTGKAHWGRWLAAIALAAVIVATFFVAKLPRNSENLEPITALPFTSFSGQETAPSVSPDGSRVAFSWDNATTKNSGTPAYDLYIKAIGSETLLRLTNHPSQWISSTWSPDGTQIAFRRLAGADNGIYVIH